MVLYDLIIFVQFHDLSLNFRINPVDFTLKVVTIFSTISLQRIIGLITCELMLYLPDIALKALVGDKATQVSLHGTKLGLGVLLVEDGLADQIVAIEPLL